MTKKKGPKGFQPMLAAQEPKGIRFPVLASPKIDGVRALVRGGALLSRKLIPIPNKFTQGLFGQTQLENLDGELVVGSPSARDCMQKTMSGVTTIEGVPNVRFFVFDYISPGQFRYRLDRAREVVAGLTVPNVVMIPHDIIETQEELDAYEDQCLRLGYEGAMIRDPWGAYKEGRSTAKEGGLVKLKRFAQDEAEIVGYSELLHNANEAEEDELGNTKRSTHQENLVPMGTLGSITCHLLDPDGGRVFVRDAKGYERAVEFSIGSGFTAEQRAELWARRDELEGRVVSFRHFKNAGVKTAPRFPVFVSFREEFDR